MSLQCHSNHMISGFHTPYSLRKMLSNYFHNNVYTHLWSSERASSDILVCISNIICILNVLGHSSFFFRFLFWHQFSPFYFLFLKMCVLLNANHCLLKTKKLHPYLRGPLLNVYMIFIP